MIVIYHNPESLESNACLKILETSKHDHEVIKYEEKPLDKIKLTKIIKLLNIKPKDLIRKNSKIWKDNFQVLEDDGHKFNDDNLIEIMIEYQEIIERPIVINGEKAVIGIPATRVFDIITQKNI